MKYNIKTYHNEGKGLLLKSDVVMSDAESKVLMAHLKSEGYKRIKGNGLIGITMELNDLEKNVQITLERIVEWYDE